MSSLILKRASTSRSSGELNDDDYDVLADGVVVGRIMRAAAAPVGTPWLWTLAFGMAAFGGRRAGGHGRLVGPRPGTRVANPSQKL
jgi:hypothetical protein